MIAESSDRLVPMVSDFAKRRVLVLGDAILDEYLSGDCSRISPEAPVPVVRVHSARRVLGGAANTAANVAALGGHAMQPGQTVIGYYALDLTDGIVQDVREVRTIDPTTQRGAAYVREYALEKSVHAAPVIADISGTGAHRRRGRR